MNMSCECDYLFEEVADFEDGEAETIGYIIHVIETGEELDEPLRQIGLDSGLLRERPEEDELEEESEWAE